MFPRQATWLILTGATTLVSTALAYPQTQPPPQPPPVKSSTTSVPIIPVSLTNEQVAATVNGEKILVGEVRQVLDQRPPFPVALTEDQRKQLRHAALDVLLEDAVMRQYLNKQVPQVSQADFNKENQAFEAALAKEKKDRKTFLRESGQTDEQVTRDIIARMQWKTLLTRYYPEAKLKSYYDANKVYFDKVFVKASHILIKLPANATKEQRQQAMQQLLTVRQEIITGKVKFEDAAKQLSQCPTKDKGGDIGQFPYKFVVVPEFARAAFSMRKGEISDVVSTVFGLHLILVTDRTAGEPSNFETMRDTVREVWAQDDDLYARVLADQRKSANIKVLLP